MMTLEFFERVNAGEQFALPLSLSAYLDKGKLSWPSGSAVLPGAIVHPRLQDRDFRPLAIGDPLWLGVDGSVTVYDGQCGDVVRPIFVNEAAYYHAASGLGIGVCEPITWQLADRSEWPLRRDGERGAVIGRGTRHQLEWDAAVVHAREVTRRESERTVGEEVHVEAANIATNDGRLAE